VFGFEDLGGIPGVGVDVRELRDAKGRATRGLIAEVTENQNRQERAFIDADEIPDLLNGLRCAIKCHIESDAVLQL